jgi:hypothetical protein
METDVSTISGEIAAAIEESISSAEIHTSQGKCLP